VRVLPPGTTGPIEAALAFGFPAFAARPRLPGLAA